MKTLDREVAVRRRRDLGREGEVGRVQRQLAQHAAGEGDLRAIGEPPRRERTGIVVTARDETREQGDDHECPHRLTIQEVAGRVATGPRDAGPTT